MKYLNLIEKHPRLLLQIKLAQKTGTLKFSPQTMEISPGDEDGMFKRSGFYAEDVTGFWMPDNFKTYIEANISAFKEAMEEFGFFQAFGFLSLSLPWSGWAWVVDAKKTIPDEIVMNKIAELRRANRGKKITYNYEEMVSQITPEEVQDYLSKNYLQISPAIWVSESDPSCFIYDEAFKPFALSDGWSSAQLGEIFEEWYEALVGEKTKAQLVLNASW